MDNEMISAGWKCLLLWQILIPEGCLNKRDLGGGQGGEHFIMCAETTNP